MADIAAVRCPKCQGAFSARAPPCPNCGGRELEPFSVPDLGRVVAAVELLVSSERFPAPHRLALVEFGSSFRVLARVDGALPQFGEGVRVSADGPGYVAVPIG